MTSAGGKENYSTHKPSTNPKCIQFSKLLSIKTASGCVNLHAVTLLDSVNKVIHFHAQEG